MNAHTVLFASEALLLAFGLGATIWFFFVQTPALLIGLGMERFLPLQMRLVRTYAAAMGVTTVLVLLAAWVRVGLSGALLPAAVAALTAVGMAGIAVPRAVRSGGQALRAVRAGEGADADLASFTSVGGGQPTKTWHRVVVVAVLVMTAGLLGDGADLLGREEAAPPVVHGSHQPGSASAAAAALTHASVAREEDARWSADPRTVENVHALHALVGRLRSRPDAVVGATDVAALQDGFQAVFRDCTMEGADHDALHDLLIPVGEHLAQVAEGGSSRAALASMDEALAGFDSAFRAGE